MPSLGSGLSLGTISRLPNFDFDASAFITANNIPDSFSAPIYGRNLLGFSNEFRFTQSGGTWNGSGAGALVTIGSRTITNPFGVNNAVEVFQTNQSYGRILRGNNTTGGSSDPFVVSNVKYVFSFYAKAGNYSYAGARIGGRCVSSTDGYITFNLSNGQTTSVTPLGGTIHSATATSVGNGWYRCVLIYTTPSTGQNANFIDIAMPTSTGGSGDFGDSTKYIYVYGAQLENGDSVTDYSENTGSAFSSVGTQNILSYELVNPRKQINDFVTGVKNLGFWNNMVCWPLRSFQNLSGSTLNSLGGYGTYNATKTNNPTIQLNGMWSTNGNQVLSHSALPFGTGAFSHYSVVRPLGFLGYQGVTGGYDGSGSASFGAYQTGFYQGAGGATYDIRLDTEIDPVSLGANYSRVFASNTFAQNRIHSIAYTRNDQTLKVYANNVFLGQNSGLTAGTNLTRTGTTTLLNRLVAAQTSAMVMPFSAYFVGVELTNAQITDFHNLYKTTLGYGLSYL